MFFATKSFIVVFYINYDKPKDDPTITLLNKNCYHGYKYTKFVALINLNIAFRRSFHAEHHCAVFNFIRYCFQRDWASYITF